MQNAPRVIDQIADLTALRDVELIEFSLLKGLYGFLAPKSLRVLSFSCDMSPRKEVVCRGEKYEVHHENIEVETFIYSAVESMKERRLQEYYTSLGENLLYIYELHNSRRTETVLVLVVAEHLTKMNAYMLSGMLQVYRNYCDLLTDSQTDELTGLPNRKTFEDTISKVYELVVPYPGPVKDEKRADEPCMYWLSVIDIDHFKQVNDTYGHLYGDEVLIHISQILNSCFRLDDLLFRFGGEEFVVILRTPSREKCAAALERFRAIVEERSFPGAGRITVSVGVAKMQRETFHITLLDYADQALYHSKRTGRNRVTFFDDMVAEGLAKKEEVQSGDIELF
jgi:diguanylate cyclase (GGDEF)-like protein